ncbi:MAG TPA: diguanylate cyclase, partial [Negativicutes bacterium]
MQYKHILRQRITTGAASLCGQHSCTLAKQQKYHQNVYLTALHKTALGLMNHLDLTDLLQTIIKMACELIGTTHGCISLVDTEKEILECKVALGFYTQYIGNSVVENQGVIGKVWKTRSPLTINDYPAWAHHLPDKFNQLQAVVGVPLLSNNMVVGVIALAHIETNRNFNEKNMEVLHQFAQLASIALDNARLYTAAQHELAERQKAEEALRKSQSKNRALLNVIPDLIYRIDKSGVILDFRGAKHLLVLPPEKILCKNIREVWPQTLSQQAMYYIKRVIDASAPQVFEYQIQLNSSMVHQEARIVLSGEDEVLVILRDITKRKQLETKLTYLSLHDQITGLYNRTHFEHSLRQMQASSYFPFSIVVCDVDGLKLVNDTLGHDAGDTLLKTAADILKQCFRTKDLVARIGGDEFAILLPNSLKAPVETACRRIRDAIT